jgi:acyl-CoA thioesterase FadM
MPATDHVPFYLALEVAAGAWMLALAVTCADLLTPHDLAVVNATSNFSHEIFLGEAAFDVCLERIGVSSLQFTVAIEQHGRAVGQFATTLVRVDERREKSVALSSAQRAALERLRTLTLAVLGD